jgi:hypothetical protein
MRPAAFDARADAKAEIVRAHLPIVATTGNFNSRHASRNFARVVNPHRPVRRCSILSNQLGDIATVPIATILRKARHLRFTSALSEKRMH